MSVLILTVSSQMFTRDKNLFFITGLHHHEKVFCFTDVNPSNKRGRCL